MEFRHLRCFIAVAEELHFARAAERLHIEQSPLSRAIKELEEDLGVKLFVRTTRSTRLTRAGKLFQEHVPRVFTALQQARDSVKAAANGFHGQLRVALSDGITPSRFSTFLALCRQEEPEIEIRLSEVSLAQQIKGLHDDLYDVGFAQSDEVGDGVIAEPVWDDPLMIAVPARHPLLKYKRMLCPTVFRARCPTPICACSMPFECPVSGAESRPPTGWFGSKLVLASGYEAVTRNETLKVLLVLERIAENYARAAMLLSTDKSSRSRTSHIGEEQSFAG